MGRVAIWIRNGMLLAVLGAFVFFFGQPKGSSDHPSKGGNVVLSVNGEDVPRDVFEYFRELNEQTFKQYSQQGVDTEQLSKLIDQQTLQSLLQRYLMSQEAESLGLSASDASVKQSFQQEFTKDGVYDRDIAERVLNRSGLSAREYASQIRRDLLMRNFSRFVASPVRISDGDVRDEIVRSDTKVTLRVATASKAALREHITVSPEDAKALLEKEPERVKGAYQMHVADYTKEEQIHARHMLFTGDDAEAQAIKAKARLDAGEKFPDVARQVSADQATRDEGGDLGSFPRGRMMPAFDEVAFALEVGKPSGPVKTERGVHLILVESHEPASQTPFEAVAETLAADLLRDDRAAEAARTATNLVLEKTAAGETFVKAADEAKLPVSVTPPFSFKDPQLPGLAGVPDAREAAFALTPEHPVARRVFADPENLYVIALQTRDAPSEEQIAGEMSTTRERMLQRARGLTTGAWFNARLKELQAAGKVQQFEVAAGR